MDNIKKLKTRIKELEDSNKELAQDRNIYRDYVVKTFKENLKLVNTHQHYSPEQIIQNITQVFAKAAHFIVWF